MFEELVAKKDRLPRRAYERMDMASLKRSYANGNCRNQKEGKTQTYVGITIMIKRLRL
jgi:hypothetical protein